MSKSNSDGWGIYGIGFLLGFVVLAVFWVVSSYFEAQAYNRGDRRQRVDV